MNSGGGAPRTHASIQPNLQPRPIAISPLRPVMQNMKFGQAMVAQPGSMMQHMGQNQFMVGAVTQALPMHMTQPRMASQVIQQSAPRMAMYVQGQAGLSQVGQQNLQKIVTGLPVYQNATQFQPGTIRIHQGPVVTGTSASTSTHYSQPQMTLALPAGQGHLQGQFQQLGSSGLRPAQVIQTGPGQMTYRTAGQMQGTSFGFSGTRPQITMGLHLRNIRPATSMTQTLVGLPQSIQPKPSHGQLITSQPSHGQLIASQPSHGQLISSQPSHGQLIASQPSHGQLIASQPSHGQLVASQPSHGQLIASQPSHGQLIASQPSHGQLLASPTPLTSMPSVSTQYVTALTQIPTPQFFTSPGLGSPGSPVHSTSQLFSPTCSTPMSPLVPLSPGMFQVARTISPSQIFSSSANMPQIQSAILPFAGQCGGTMVANQPQILTAITSQQSTSPISEPPVLTKCTEDFSEGTSDLSQESSSPTTVKTEEENSREASVDDNSAADMETFKESVLNLRMNKDVAKLKIESEQVDESGQRKNKGIIASSDADSIDIGMKKSESTSGHEEDKAKSNSEEFNDEENLTEESKSQGEEEEPEFVWEEYLQEVGASAVPPTAFKHVEFSLQSGFVKGMKLEVPNKADPSSYWVSTVLLTCGPLLRLRYDGYEEDSSSDFWCELATSEIHPIGWCAQNGKNLEPPEAIKDKFSDWREFLVASLTGARTAPSYLLDKKTGTTPIDQLKPGVRLELQDSLNPLSMWLVQVIENVGGRLYLRLEGTQSSSHYFWMFYLNPRLHPIGWGQQEGCSYTPPKDIHHEHSSEEWDEILQQALTDSQSITLPVDVFKDQAELKPHRFEVGMKLEALCPGQNAVSPATVTKVINSKYFIVEMDDLRVVGERDSIQICCHSEYLGIFPVSWCQFKGIRLVNPQGWGQPEFVWGDYLNFCGAKAAPEKLFNSGTDDHEFERGMKLEAVNPENPNQICAATITKIVGPLLWIHLDHIKNIPSHIEDIDSHNLFPVGWCESNGYQLKPPRKVFGCKRPRHFSESLNGEALRSETYSHVKSGNEGGSWCPVIYFNHKCFSGPYLSKGRMADLPKSVGPGPIGLVLKSVLTLLINVAYKSCKVLKELQLEGPANPKMQQQMLKAKYKGKSYRGVVQVSRTENQLEEFCRNVCIKLECCPYLFSPLFVDDICPENCQQLTKTKYNYSYGKKKKRPVGRPPLSTTQKQTGPKVPGKRGRKRKRFHLIHKKSHSHPADHHYKYQNGNGDVYANNESKDEGFIDDYRFYEGEDHHSFGGFLSPSKKRKYTHHIPPPTDIQTRGAKLPKYSFERKTHKKILHSSSSPPNKSKPRPLLGKELAPDLVASCHLQPREESLQLSSNPLYWSINQVVDFIKTTDCVHLARIIKEQEIDGQALLLLNLSTIQEHLDLKLGPAVKLCHQIERMKIAFYENYAH